MKKTLVCMAILLALASAGTQAIYIKAPETIVMQQEQREIPITVGNESFSGQDFRIRFLSSFDAVVSPSTGTLNPGETRTATISIMPDESLAGSTYRATLEIEIGNQKELREISVIFKEPREQNTPVEPGSTGLFSLASISSLFTPENVLNGTLALIAAILLIAFIARFIKRLEETE